MSAAKARSDQAAQPRPELQMVFSAVQSANVQPACARSLNTESSVVGWLICRAALALLCMVSAGCLGEPPIEDVWTRLDVLEVTPIGTNGKMPAGETVDLKVRARIVFRNILTGAVAVEIRSSEQYKNSDLDLREDAPRLQMTDQISALLESSSIVAGVSQEVTGFDHLIRDFEFEFQVQLPEQDSGGLFVVAYFGQSEDLEMPGGEEVTMVIPGDFAQLHILPGAKAIWVE